MVRNRYDLESEERNRREVVATAESILHGDIGIIDGARRLSTLSHLVVDDWRADADFLVFGVLDSETDHFPIGEARERWDPAALKQCDAVVQQIEAEARADVERACRSVISRFAMP